MDVNQGLNVVHLSLFNAIEIRNGKSPETRKSIIQPYASRK